MYSYLAFDAQCVIRVFFLFWKGSVIKRVSNTQCDFCGRMNWKRHHLVKWNDVCGPLNEDYLAVHSLYEVNVSLLVK